ncbi:SnoaL-like domain-containing protein [Arthrobacter sp. 9AX]|uniref:nuclear transport factor 2 family protein n=1 Tax=Arthrobacter sp. 9AX TaxID=2653131 RepID=UPI0012F28D40|nr:nuclear transport factor 2 family protein [Arthrobacter sp. 9AX]VXB32984.1 SnoaL-like domain-containing protein [Arthrobacter sp. 9AX]
MPAPSSPSDTALDAPAPDHPPAGASPLDCVLGFIRVLESGGGGARLRPFLADSFLLVEAPHLLAPEGSTRTLSEVLAGADQSSDVVADQEFVIRRTTCEGGRVAVEADWSATVQMDLRYWDRGEVIRARTSSVFEVRDGLIISQNSYDCYYR